MKENVYFNIPNTLNSNPYSLSIYAYKEYPPDLNYAFMKVSKANVKRFGDADSVYDFLYGNPAEALCKDRESFDKEQIDPIKWTETMVQAMEWDMFLISLYTFLISKNSFKHQSWNSLSEIINILLTFNEEKWRGLLRDKSFNGTPTVFRDCVSFFLMKKARSFLTVNTAFVAYTALTKIENMIQPDKYAELENEFCKFFCHIGMERIHQVFEVEYSDNELMNFDIEKLFFYDALFNLPSAKNERIQHCIYAVTFDFLRDIGDVVLKNNKVLLANSCYEKSLKYAQNDQAVETIKGRIDRIKDKVSVANREHGKIEAKRERQYKKKSLCERILLPMSAVSVIILAISLILLLISFIFSFHTNSRMT